MADKKTYSGPFAMASWPIAITVLLVLIRLIGELLKVDVQFLGTNQFNANAGGGGSLLGGSWLIPIFGFVFGWRWTGQRRAPDKPGIALGLFGLGAAVVAIAIAIAFNFKLQGEALAGLIGGTSLVAILLAFRAWPRHALTSLIYAYSVRLVVVGITFATIFAGADTHFGAFPPDSEIPETKMEQAVALSIAQVTMWPAMTMCIGGFLGTFASMMRGRKKGDHQDV